MSSFNRCRKAITNLRCVMAAELDQVVLENIVTNAGFDSIEEAKRYAEQYYDKIEKNRRMSGDLAQKNQVWAHIAEQLPTGRVRFPYSAKKTLGRMRAMVRLVALEKGYRPLFNKVQGVDRFYTDYMHPFERDIYNTMYYVPVKPFEGKPKAFIELPRKVKEQLRDFRIDNGPQE